MSLKEQNAAERQQSPPVVLEYGYSHWTISSQGAADLYAAGARLWTKDSLRDIEQQLTEFKIRSSFAIRRIDGTIIYIKNPMYGVTEPIWKPIVEFRNYWRLVKSQPDGPPETYYCTYLIEWFNQIGTQFYGPIEGFEAVFQQIKKSWNNSATRQLLQDRIRALIHTSSDCQIIKVICFGLGDISVRPPSWWRIKNRELENPDRDTVMVEASMLQHCAALTIVDALRQYYLEKENSSGNTTIIRLLTQDPKYTEQTRECLRANGFEVVGPAGAGGFAEVDNETVVFSAFATAPIKQIIADLARPVLFIGSFPLEDFDIRMKPSPDAESPRTREMWKSYAKSDFPVAGEEIPSMASLHKLSICARNAKVD